MDIPLIKNYLYCYNYKVALIIINLRLKHIKMSSQQAHTASSAEIRIKRINIGMLQLHVYMAIELEMLKNLSNDYKFNTFETVLGLYIRVSIFAS